MVIYKKPTEHKIIWREKNRPPEYISQNIKCTGYRKNVKSCKGKRASTLYKTL